MSRENLEKFFKFLMENKEGQAKMKGFGGDIDALTAYAREQGYDFSPEELREYQEKARKIFKSRVQKKLRQPEASSSPGAREFYALIKLSETDENVAGRLTELAKGTPEELIAYGREKGFTFNEQDMQTVGKDILEPSDELSDEELELASGGIVVMLALFLGAVAVAGAVGVAAGGAAVIGGVLAVNAMGNN
jgi:predicted ribosomally synthesized peptide with nif11-like leader